MMARCGEDRLPSDTDDDLAAVLGYACATTCLTERADDSSVQGMQYFCRVDERVSAVATVPLAPRFIVPSLTSDSRGFSVGGSLFGLLGCFALAGACKLAARLFLKRPENYYDDDF